MGKVLRARDLKLGRDVALKVLPAEVADQPERLARFRREAQILASLNHPRIGAIHGLEEADGSSRSRSSSSRARTSRSGWRGVRLPLDEALAVARTDRGRARVRARARRRAPRPQARQRQDDCRRRREDPRFRPGQGLRRDPASGSGSDLALVLAHAVAEHERGGSHPRHRGLHEPGAGARPAGRQACGHLVLRRRAVRDADGRAAVHRRDRDRRAGGRRAPGDLLGRPAARNSRGAPAAGAALPRTGCRSPAARHRRGTHRDRGRDRAPGCGAPRRQPGRSATAAEAIGSAVGGGGGARPRAGARGLGALAECAFAFDRRCA